MSNKSVKSKHTWARFGLYGFWALIGVMAISLLTVYGVELLSVGAQTIDSPDFVGPLQEGSQYGALVCSLYLGAGQLIGILMVLMFVGAGIIYATSQGESGGEASGITLAKSMMIAAITGALLYALGLVILGTPCSDHPGGGWLQDLLVKFGPMLNK